MSVTPEQMIDCAEAMLNAATDEAQFRSVCSRAYYGAFHAANVFHNNLPAPGTVGNAKGRHEQLIAQLTNPQISKNNKRYYVSQALAKSLRPLIANRVMADYQVAQSVERSLANASVAGAKVVQQQAA
jgi:uncharacterized protein (UPF0332 family)